MSVFIVVQPAVFAQAPGTAGAQPPPSPFSSLPILFFLAVIFFFVIIRPQQKRAKEQAALVSSLKTGDRVVTSGGFHGMISNVKEQTVIVKFAENVKIEIDKASVATVTKPAAEIEVKAITAA